MKEIVLGRGESSKNGEELSKTIRVTLNDSRLLRLTTCTWDSRALYSFFPVIIFILIKPRRVQGVKN